jgi:glycosyltransferase involved in cell wall biosynthesis
MLRPKISIITPTFNHERYMASCIDSVLAQTYPNWEQIIIDDGSTDKTAEIVAQYGDERIRYVRQENVGIWRLHETYNKALALSRGEIIAVLEGDDFWPPKKLEKQMRIFERPEVVLTWGKAAVTDSKGEIKYFIPDNMNWFKERSRQDIIKRLLMEDFIPACTAMIRKDALTSIGGFKQADYTFYVDYPTWLELSLLGEFAMIEELMGYWRTHDTQATRVFSETMLDSSAKYSIYFFERMPPEIRKSIKLSSRKIERNYKQQMAVCKFDQARIALFNREWNEAKDNLESALKDGKAGTRFKSLLGLMCYFCRTDMEWIAALAGRPVLK